MAMSAYPFSIHLLMTHKVGNYHQKGGTLHKLSGQLLLLVKTLCDILSPNNHLTSFRCKYAYSPEVHNYAENAPCVE